MDRRSTAARILTLSALAAYLFIGTVLTGPAPTIGVLLVVLLLWFSVYRFRHKGVGNRELATKMLGDLRGMLEGIEEGLARQESRIRETTEQEERARAEREKRRAEGESRRANRQTLDPATRAYAEMIENRVRERGGRDEDEDHTNPLRGAKGQKG